MAEGFAKIKLNKKYKIYSAGVESHGLNPNAIAAMRELGIDITQQVSTKISRDQIFQYDFIITLCGDARDKCPILDKNTKHIHWNLDDPANAKGRKDEIMNIYRKVRDQILFNIDSLL